MGSVAIQLVPRGPDEPMLLCLAVHRRASVVLALCTSLAASACSLSHSVFRPRDGGSGLDVPADRDVVTADRGDAPPPDAPPCPPGQTLCGSACVSLDSD